MQHDGEPIKDFESESEIKQDDLLLTIRRIPIDSFSFIPNISEPLKLFIDPNLGAILGRSPSFHKKYGSTGIELIGAISEDSESEYGSLLGVPVYIDLIKPHVIFVAGKRGSGKSYTLGVIAESLNRCISHNEIRVSVIIIDTVDVFRQMVHPNDEQRDLLKKWGLEPENSDNVNVFIPYKNYKKIPEHISQANHLFPLKISPAELNASDWVYILEKDGNLSVTQENLLGEAIDLVKKGYKGKISGELVEISPKKAFGIDDLIECINASIDLNRFYAFSTRTAIIQKLRNAKKIGIFHKDGTNIKEIAKENAVSIIDVSSLGANAMRALSILTSILSRQILSYRMEWSDEGISKREELPPTWLIVDEAQTLVPRTGRTPATDALISYAKLGRRFGCSLVLCTQQPASVNDQVISQADILISHNLSYDADIRALKERAPAYFPEDLKSKAFISSLPSGVSIAFDQVTENARGFILQIRPRLCRHGGEDKLSDILKTIELLPDIEPEENAESSSELDLKMKFDMSPSEPVSSIYETSTDSSEILSKSHEYSGSNESKEESAEYFSILEKLSIKLFTNLPDEVLIDTLDRKMLYSKEVREKIYFEFSNYYQTYCKIIDNPNTISKLNEWLSILLSYGIKDFNYLEIQGYPFIIGHSDVISLSIAVGGTYEKTAICVLLSGPKSDINSIISKLK